MLQDLGLEGIEPTGTPDEPKFEEASAERLAAAYKEVRAQQERAGKAQRERVQSKKGPRQAKLAKHSKGDMVLYWEPVQARNMQNSEEKRRGVVKTSAPRKWAERWSGPHTILDLKPDETGHRYTFYHKERGEVVNTHVNKLCRYQPWKDGITSTSGDIDAKRLFKCGEWVENDSLVIVPLVEPYPFGIAKVLHSSEKGKLELQWLGNASNNTKGPYDLGWKGPRGFYYAPEPRKQSHKPYTAADDNVVLNQKDIVMHGFELTATGLAPEPLLRAIARSPLVWWDPQATPASA